MKPEEIPSSAVREFYDEFRDSHMVRYRAKRNRRLVRATERVIEYLRPESRVLEIGCGVGVVTEEIASRVPHGRVWACDISPRNVEFARETVRSSNVDFFVADVVHEFGLIEQRVSAAVDVVAMIDVIEHLPLATHAELLSRLRGLMGADAVLILTYPSPEYQRYLREFEPEHLQIIDEIVELPELLGAAREAGLSLRFYSLQDVWRRNQYVHCVFQTGAPLDRVVEKAPSVWRRIRHRVRSEVESLRERVRS